MIRDLVELAVSLRELSVTRVALTLYLCSLPLAIILRVSYTPAHVSSPTHFVTIL